MFFITINGQKLHCAPDTRILDALQKARVKVPTLCHDYRLAPTGACRLCIVDVEGKPRPVTACNNQIEDGMVIHTHSKKIEEQRRTLLELLASNYPKSARSREPHHDFHKWLHAYGITDLPERKSYKTTIDASNPYIQVDMSRCIYCYRCVRICEEVQGQFVWQIWGRGDQTRILADSMGSLAESTCTSCGACADSCPSGAIEDKSLIELGVPPKWTRTTCAYCGVGCEMMVGTLGNKIQNIRPALDAPVNKGHLCSKGRYAFGYVHSADRMHYPLIRENGTWKKASWTSALEYVADKLRAIKEKHGADSIGVLGSSRATNEENYLTQKFARVVLKTNNVDCCARVCHTPSAAALQKMLGSSASTNSLDDIEKAHTIMLCGTNTTENHPITGARVKQAVLKGAKLIVIDPRTIELAQYATVHLPLRPGTNIPLFNAMAHTIVTEGLCDEPFIKERVDGFFEFQKFIDAWTPEQAAVICGLDSEQIRRAARLYASAKPSMVLNGLGVTELTEGTKTVMSIINLALITGNLGRCGAGINPMRGQNNVQGAAYMGCAPTSLAGGISIKKGKALCESVWGAAIPSSFGMDLLEMLDAAAQKCLHALYIIGYDVFLSNPNANISREAFKNLKLVIIQDMFMTKTAEEFGHVFLPVCSSFEKTGTFMNGERRIQLVRQAIDPLPGTKTDSQIICELAHQMGQGKLFHYGSPADIWDEIRAVWPEGRGITYDRLEQCGLQWPCPDIDHPGTQVLHMDTFPMGKKATLQKIDFGPSPEQTDAQFPLVLMTGRNLYQFNASTMSGRTPNATIRPSDTLDINPADAKELSVASFDQVRVVSHYGDIILPVRVSDSVKPGELFATFNTPDLMINQLTSPFRDQDVDTPEYKITAVRLERIDIKK